MRVGRYLDSIFAFCLRAALAALPPSIWLNCASLTFSIRLAPFPARLPSGQGWVLSDQRVECYPTICACLVCACLSCRQSPSRAPAGRSRGRWEARLSNAQRPSDRRTRRGTRGNCRRPSKSTQRIKTGSDPKDPGCLRWLTRLTSRDHTDPLGVNQGCAKRYSSS
jgi:hypothetical protein